MSNGENLKLMCCPFCGKSDKDMHDNQFAVSLTSYGGLSGGCFLVQCHWCGANGPLADSKEDAIAEWNKALRHHIDKK
jgi:Lar family restriction alleviation protein